MEHEAQRDLIEIEDKLEHEAQRDLIEKKLGWWTDQEMAKLEAATLEYGYDLEKLTEIM